MTSLAELKLPPRQLFDFPQHLSQLFFSHLNPIISTSDRISVATMSERVANKVQAVAKEDFDQAKALAQDAIRSAAYLYPFKVRGS
jgi:hypothetical protein